MKLLISLFGLGYGYVYDWHEITAGYTGTWREKVVCPAEQAICGVNIRVTDPKGALGDDVANNAVKFKCCNIDPSQWNEGKTSIKINTRSWGNWAKEYQMCREGTYMTGMDVLLESKQGHDDDTAMGGVKIICDDVQAEDLSGLHTRKMKTKWGSWVGKDKDELQSVKEKTLFCGGQARVQSKKG